MKWNIWMQSTTVVGLTAFTFSAVIQIENWIDRFYVTVQTTSGQGTGGTMWAILSMSLVMLSLLKQDKDNQMKGVCSNRRWRPTFAIWRVFVIPQSCRRCTRCWPCQLPGNNHRNYRLDYKRILSLTLYVSHRSTGLTCELMSHWRLLCLIYVLFTSFKFKVEVVLSSKKCIFFCFS